MFTIIRDKKTGEFKIGMQPINLYIMSAMDRFYGEPLVPEHDSEKVARFLLNAKKRTREANLTLNRLICR